MFSGLFLASSRKAEAKIAVAGGSALNAFAALAAKKPLGPNDRIDLNRAGVPLLEIVSEPDLHSLEAIKQYSESLRQVLRYLNVSTGDMEKGAMRFEANISLRPVRSLDLSKTRVEVKNLNSFRSMVRAVEYEIARQEEILRAGGVVEQETMGWDDTHNTTITQRSKEEAHDYRYFPEPDLPRLQISRAWVAEIRSKLPELPDERQARLIREYGLSGYDADVITAERAIAEYYDRAVAAGREREVLARMAEGHSNGSIARLLGIGDAAVSKHIGNVFMKLNLEDTDGHRRVLAVLTYLRS